MSLIASVEGTLEGKSTDFALVRVGGGITLRVYVPGYDLAALPRAGEPVKFVTHLIVREDDLQLYGFASEQGRTLFESLLGISGVGPKAALAVLSVLSPEDLAGAIVAGDATTITRAPGVGKRTAERIILELKGKLADEFVGMPTVPIGAPVASAGDPALTWLLGLGFSALEARQALSVEQDGDMDTGERVRRALQRMGQGA
ncbi:MAG: Holliday junction branch migration protein RuvA [Dehalococcoidia bacterium]